MNGPKDFTSEFTHHSLTLGSKFCGNCACQKVGTNGYEAGYFASTAIPAAALYQSAAAFFTGDVATPVLGTSPTDGFPIAFEPLHYSKFNTNCDGTGICRLSDIETALDGTSISRAIHTLAQKFAHQLLSATSHALIIFFMPVIGQGGQWKLGAGVSAHKLFWHNECDEKSVGLWFYANVQHLFNACQERAFDLAGKPNSRYMLAEKMIAQNTHNRTCRWRKLS